MIPIHFKTKLPVLFLFFITLVIGLTGCEAGRTNIPDFTQPQNPELGELPDMAEEESTRLTYDQELLRNKLEKIQPVKIDIAPVVPKYNPLDGHFVSMALVDEELRVALFSLAKNVKMNLLIDPDIQMDNKRITVNFENAPASLILEQILNASKLSYTIDKNLIRVSGFQERIFALTFLDISATATYSVGGDVLGGDDDELNVGGLSGRFAIEGKGGKENNPYVILDTMMPKLVSPEGKYTINSQTGTLYVRDTIQSIESISKVINHLKTMMERQILIEAQIIEVSLLEGYQFGIDWNSLRSGLAASTNLVDSLSWGLESGLVLNQSAGIPTNQFNGVIDALSTYGDARVVSNPTLRVKHSQPALISVGTSFTYIKTVTVTRSSGIVDGTNSTEVETSSVFDGLILGVIPFIEDDQHLTLQVNPIKSDVDEQSLIAIDLGENISVSLPEVDVKELSTVIGLKSNDTIVLGGLIDRVKGNVSKGFPIFEAIPFLGQLVREDYKISDNKELVVILKVTIL